jgi:O-antigen/teichoic acid export membrane protein
LKNIKKKYDSLSVPVKATFWFTVCNFMLRGISFISVPLFARYLPKEEYGIVTTYNAYRTLLFLFASFELHLGPYARGLIKFKGQEKNYTVMLLIISNLLSLVSFTVIFSLRAWFLALTDLNITILVLTYIVFLFLPAYSCWIYRRRFHYEYKKAVFATIIYSLLVTAVPLVSILLYEKTAILKIESMLIVEVLFCIPFYILSIIRIDWKSWNKDFFRRVLRFIVPFTLPLVFHSLSYMILEQMDRIMVKEMVGAAEAAIYSVAYGIASVVSIFHTSINQVYQPYRYKKMEKGDFSTIRRTSNGLLLIFGCIIVLFVLVSPEAIKILFSDDYLEAIWIMPPITTSIFFMFLYSIFVDIESYYEETKYVMYASLISSLLNIILNYFGILRFGYYACGYTTLVSYIVFAILHYIFMRKVCKKKGIHESIIDKRFIMLISVMLLAVVFIVTLLYSHIFIRYALVFFIFIILLRNRNFIFEIIKGKN